MTEFFSSAWYVKPARFGVSNHRSSPVQWVATPNLQSDADQPDAATDQAIAACGGDAREAVKALILANYFLETELGETEGGGLDGLRARKTY